MTRATTAVQTVMSSYGGDIIEVYWRVWCIAGYRIFGRLDVCAASGAGLLNGVSGTVWCHKFLKLMQAVDLPREGVCE